MDIIRSEAEKCGIYSPLSDTLQEAKRAYKICQYNFNRLKTHSKSHRRTFLKTRINKAKIKGDLTKAQQIKNVLTQEVEKYIWRGIKHDWHKATGGILSKVAVNINSIDKLIHDKVGVEEAIMSNNNKRFKFTYGTPLMTESTLNIDLGFLGKKTCGEDIKWNI